AGGGLLATAEIDAARDDVARGRLRAEAADRTVRLLTQGTSLGGAASAKVVSTLSGTVLDVPVAASDVVFDLNAYREGTTMAGGADMSELLLKGIVDESFVGRLSIGMPLSVRVGALTDRRIEATLEYVAPRAIVDRRDDAADAPSRLDWLPGGITRFEI